MSLTFTSGDMFDRPFDIRINTVNCVGVMGTGLAKRFKLRYPEMYLSYQRACYRGEILPGQLHVWQTLDDHVVNVPTKRDWREPSRYEDIEAGLRALQVYLVNRPAELIALPALGCGLGGLDWQFVKPLIVTALGDVEHDIFVFTPKDSR